MTIVLSRWLRSHARLAEGDDPIDQLRNHPAREIMPPARKRLDLRARHQARDVAAAGDRQQRVVLAVQDECRHLDALDLLDAIARGDDRKILPGTALREPAAAAYLLHGTARLCLPRRQRQRRGLS